MGLKFILVPTGVIYFKARKESIFMKSVDYNEGEKIVLLCIISNIILTIFKVFAGIFGHSNAMIADGLHSGSDIIADIVVLIGIKIAKKPVDDNHHYGHGKVEPIAASFVGISLIFAAIMILKSIIESIISHSFVTPTFLALGAAVVSIVVKEILFRVAYRAGKKINSEALMADAWHQRSDAYSSIGTFFGILGSMMGKWFGIPILGYLDPIAGVVVACLIFKVAYDILKTSIKGLMDASPDKETVDEIINVSTSVDGVKSRPLVKARYIGCHLFVDMEIEVDSKITVEEGHDIAEEVRKEILDKVADVYDVLVHVEPIEAEDNVAV